MNTSPPADRPWWKGRAVQIAAALLFTAAVALLFLQNLSLGTLAEAFYRIDPAWAAAAFAAYLAVTALRALRFGLAGARLRFGRLFVIAAVHAALLRVMPLRSGDLAYGILLKRLRGGGFTEGIASIVMLRLLDVAAVLPLAACAVAIWAAGRASRLGVAAAALLGVGLGVLFFALGPLSRRLAGRLAGRSASGLSGAVGRVSAVVADAYALPFSRRLALVALTAGIWISLLAWLHLTLLAVGGVRTVADGLVAGVFCITGSVVPLSLVGSFGPMEGGLALGLGATGLEPGAATALSLLVSALTFAANWLLAVPAWALALIGPGAPPEAEEGRP